MTTMSMAGQLPLPTMEEQGLVRWDYDPDKAPCAVLRLTLGIDTDAECPDEWGGWKLYSFKRHSGNDPEDFFEHGANGWYPKIGLRSKMRAGLAYLLDVYEHGGIAYSLSGEGWECPWDTAHGGALLVWEGAPSDLGARTNEDREKYARSFLQTYNAWANGQVYGYQLETEEGEDLGGCWGFFEADYMIESEIRAAVFSYMRKHGFTLCEVRRERDYEPDDPEEATVCTVVVDGDAADLTDYRDVWDARAFKEGWPPMVQ